MYNVIPEVSHKLKSLWPGSAVCPVINYLRIMMRRCIREWKYRLFFAISTVEGVEFSASRFGRFATRKNFPFLQYMIRDGHQCQWGSSGKEKDVCPEINQTLIPRFTPASCRRNDWAVQAHVLEICKGEVFMEVKIQVLGFCVCHCGIAWYVGSEVPEQPSAFLTRIQYWGSNLYICETFVGFFQSTPCHTP
jgi:hypothetical protein